ncbi:16S rRNA (cytidine(1402)-2'-O)-methyltransferase [Fundicoccus sp. Sow4_D5]|uniref:16S rRNA (cytidine(1402)-2'-O)-methyltransferase n=1 Tax=Fundicoccus sp. Sow4_D5 TaxID=3438782 RepID=UPI003F927F1B
MQIQTSFIENTRVGLTAKGKLYLVPTPIGNLDDMTFRAINTLKEVALILAEDTRHTIKLLNHFNIETKMRSFHEHSRAHEVTEWVELLESGQDLALVSDAGMPLINDPGHPLVQACLEEAIDIVALPGANAALTALIASGLSSEHFTYYGFFPRSMKEQKEVLALVGSRQETAIFYESPFRIKKAVVAIEKELGADTSVVVARELTKRYEEYIRGTAAELAAYLAQQPLKGEIVLMLEGGQLPPQSNLAEKAAQLELPYKAQVELAMAEDGLSSKDAIKQVAKQLGIKKQDVYQAYHDL